MTWQKDPATDRQLEFLNQLGYRLVRPKTKGEASLLIDALKAGLPPAAAQDRLFRVQAGLPLDDLPARQSRSGCGCVVIWLMGMIAIAGCVGVGLAFIW